MATPCTVNKPELESLAPFIYTKQGLRRMSTLRDTELCSMKYPSEGVSVLRPHHLTKIVYPDLSLLIPATESLMLPPIHDVRNRFEPKSLIQDAAVMANADRDSLAETSFFVVTEAAFVGKDTYLDTMQAVSETPERLARDMERISSWNGETMLNAVIYQATKRGKEVDRIRIRRRTSLRSESFSEEETVMYDMSMKEFNDLESVEPYVRSLGQLGHLCHSLSDRAVLHINAQLLHQTRSDLPPEKWKPPRQPRYEKVLCTFAKPINFLGLSPSLICQICATSFDRADHDAMVLNCGRSHMLCKRCLLQICQNGQVEHAKCPFCRTKFFGNDKTLEWLKYGVVGKEYAPDDEYNAYENFERSVGDLDKQHAGDNEQILTVSSSAMVRTMVMLFHGALLEPATSTPRDLQPVRCPELPIVASALESSLRTLEGAELPTSLVFSTLLNDIYQALARISLCSELRLLAGSHELEHLLENPCPHDITLRPGFVDFVRRSVSRMLQFTHCRICRCMPGGYHSHGLREYFNPDSASLVAKI